MSIDYIREILSGISISLTLVPTSIAYSLFLGMSPKVGLYASIVMVITTSILGSIPGLVSNTTAAVAVAMLGLVNKLGPEYLFVGVIIGGIMQMLFAFFEMGKIFDYVPSTVVSGFLLGLAALIAKGQINYFKDDSYFNKDGKEEQIREKLEESKMKNINEMIRDQKDKLFKIIGISDGKKWMTRDVLLSTIGLTTLGVLIMFGTHFAKIPLPGSVPGALLTVIIVTAFHYLSPWKLPIHTIGKKGKVGGELLKFTIPKVKIDFKTLLKILPYSASMAVSTLTESMLMMKKAKDILNINGNSRQENLAMGLGNVISGFTGGMGGNVCVGISQLNLMGNKSNSRISTLTAGITLILIMLFLSKYVEAIPMPALMAIMIFVVFETGDWKAFNNKNNKEKIVTLITSLVSFMTSNLAAGVLSGTAIHHLMKTICK